MALDAAVGTNVGNPVTATDPDSADTLTYSLSGTDVDLFQVGASTGQLTVKGTLDAAKTSYSVEVRVTDGKNSRGAADAAIDDVIIVTINAFRISTLPAEAVPYDTNGNGKIERDEVIKGIQDYFHDAVAKDVVLLLIRLYFATP